MLKRYMNGHAIILEMRKKMFQKDRNIGSQEIVHLEPIGLQLQQPENIPLFMEEQFLWQWLKL